MGKAILKVVLAGSPRSPVPSVDTSFRETAFLRVSRLLYIVKNLSLKMSYPVIKTRVEEGAGAGEDLERRRYF